MRLRHTTQLHKNYHQSMFRRKLREHLATVHRSIYTNIGEVRTRTWGSFLKSLKSVPTISSSLKSTSCSGHRFSNSPRKTPVSSSAAGTAQPSPCPSPSRSMREPPAVPCPSGGGGGGVPVDTGTGGGGLSTPGGKDNEGLLRACDGGISGFVALGECLVGLQNAKKKRLLICRGVGSSGCCQRLVFETSRFHLRRGPKPWYFSHRSLRPRASRLSRCPPPT